MVVEGGEAGEVMFVAVGAFFLNRAGYGPHSLSSYPVIFAGAKIGGSERERMELSWVGDWRLP